MSCGSSSPWNFLLEEGKKGRKEDRPKRVHGGQETTWQTHCEETVPAKTYMLEESPPRRVVLQELDAVSVECILKCSMPNTQWLSLDVLGVHPRH